MLKKGKTSRKITTKKISIKYKNLKKPKKTYLVNEEDLDTEMHDKRQQDLFEGESVLVATNKVFDFKKILTKWKTKTKKLWRTTVKRHWNNKLC